MDEAIKKEIAVFRFGVIADIVGRKLARGEKERIVKEKAYLPVGDPVLHPHAYKPQHHPLLGARLCKVTQSRGLYPEDRKDRGRVRVMDEETIASLVRLKKERRGMSLPVLLKEAKARGILPGRLTVSFCDLVPDLQTARGVTKRHELPRPAQVRGGTSQRHLAVGLPARTKSAA